MLEAYSLNQTLLTNGIIPFNSTALVKGETVNLSGVSSIQLNKCGVYEIAFNMTANATTAGNVVVQMTKDGVIQPQATRTITGATTATSANVPIVTLVQVTKNNGNCCCASPTTIQFINAGVGVLANNINVAVTKIC
jgi:hypothetical protein